MIVGKATCENMSHGAASFTACNGPVQNPRAHGFSTGGSSSGCGALIGSGEVDMGMGGDQGGSIRLVCWSHAAAQSLLINVNSLQPAVVLSVSRQLLGLFRTLGFSPLNQAWIILDLWRPRSET